MTTPHSPAAPQEPTPAPKIGGLVVQFGEVRDIPLNRLKASPKNVRKVSHTPTAIESRAASISYKGVLQPLVVEPEIKDGRETGYYLVSAGESRRQALRLLAQRKAVAKGAPVRCVVDTTNDPAEVSLDENFSREMLHPADQYEAFKDQADRKGYSAEEIAARYGIKPDIVRQRLRLGAVAPELLDLYREEVLTLEQVTAFAVNPDTERQLQVYKQMSPHGLQPYAIRRSMTEMKVSADDRRVVFLGLDAYVAAGGPVLRDLFTENNAGWIEDVVLLDRLVAEKLAALAQDIRDREGWKWASAHLEVPHGHGFGRIWEHLLTIVGKDSATMAALQAEEAALTDEWADVEPLPPEVVARFEAIADALESFTDVYGHTPEEKARAGVMVVLTPSGEARIDRGFVRPEDEPAPEEETAEEDADEEAAHLTPEQDRFLDDDQDQDQEGDGEVEAEAEEPAGDPAAPLPERVIAELTAHRTAALRDALAQSPDLAQLAMVHALVSRVFALGAPATCLDIRWGSRNLNDFGEGIEDSPAGLAIAERHQLWARQVPRAPEDIWTFIVGLDGDSRAGLLAHCVSLTVDGVRSWERKDRTVLGHVETLATALDLDMRAYWKPTAVRYLDRVTKAQITAAVADGVSGEAAERLSGMKKPAMVETAEPLLVEAGWLPVLLRTTSAQPAEVGAEPGGEVEPPSQAEATMTGEEDTAAPSTGSEPHGEGEPPLCDLDAVLSDAVVLPDDDEARVEALLTAAE
ncbi:ParB/RepB/Spo0J family partition protein [Caulobacter vibrioides]|jgi:ParB family chromosome partitioning protein|uniref:Putative transcriptional regulator n=3 Tax=Pseudomonadota TaxID=1224 RepID=R0D2I8_CAUVI|nr:ParB/RepB/Spo0J family partition protein [Caulobacter vibrioides]ENZ82846.1 putative transcriptional regulator [Caulobacter vibrioides OR37]